MQASIPPATFLMDATVLASTIDCVLCDGPIPSDELELIVSEGEVQPVHRICKQSIID